MHFGGEREREQLRVELIYEVKLALGFSREREIERREYSRLVNLLIGEDGRALWGNGGKVTVTVGNLLAESVRWTRRDGEDTAKVANQFICVL